MDNKTNKEGIDLIKYYEGCRLKAYQDPGGIWTIGYGTTGSHVKKGLEITQDQAEEWFLNHVSEVEKQIKAALKKELNDNQFSALVCFTYNVGIGNLKQSTLLRYVNESRFPEAGGQFEKWIYQKGQFLPGLKARRIKERELFLKA